MQGLTDRSDHRCRAEGGVGAVARGKPKSGEQTTVDG